MGAKMRKRWNAALSAIMIGQLPYLQYLGCPKSVPRVTVCATKALHCITDKDVETFGMEAAERGK